MDKNTYLLEIGVEELPAKQITRVITAFRDSVAAELEKEKMPYTDLKVWSTPRRIAVLIEGIADSLPEEQVTVSGPAISIAYQDDKPTPALLGFLKKNASGVSDIIVKNNGKFDVVTLEKNIAGAFSKDILARIAPDWITKASFDKSMRWRDYNVMFSRPIRWIVSLYNDEHLPLAIEGLTSGVQTYGHRTLANQAFTLTHAGEYLTVMEKAMIVVEPDKRKQLILSQISQIEKEHGYSVPVDEKLLDEIINIVEYPTVFIGHFDKEFLSLPIPAIVTPMKDHQRYFPAYDADGKLVPLFLGVRNGDDYEMETVAKGNEKVLRARLKDARFFYDEDRKKSLEDSIDSLKTVVYQVKLGTIYEKVLRIDALSQFIAAQLKSEEGFQEKGLQEKGLQGKDFEGNDFQETLHRAVMLCKADLNSSMVNEFDELQGIMGAIYAREDKEAEAVCAAIESHYRPRYFGDRLPEDAIGKIISIADKTDSLVGSYGIGITPKGGKDPFGLRRMMISILSVMMSDDALSFSIESLLKESSRLLADRMEVTPDEVIPLLVEAFHQRLRVMMDEKGFRFDTIEACLKFAMEDIHGFLRHCEAVNQYDREKLSAITTNMLRPLKLSAQAGDGGAVNPDLFATAEEEDFYQKINRLLPEISSNLADDIKKAIDLLEQLGEAIAQFLDKIMVMDENPAIRENRVQLMKMCADVIRSVADFEKLQF